MQAGGWILGCRIRRGGVAALLLCATLTTLGQTVTPPGTRVKHYLRGRHLQGGFAAAEALHAARQQHLALAAAPHAATLSASWTAVGPAQVATAEFGNVTGRVTSIALDPADSSGNTLYVGTTGGGVWKSTNAAGVASAVTFTPLTDTLPVFANGAAVTASLSIGAMAVANGVVLAGTGDPNDATDSYYGAGILRSADGGATWTLAFQSQDGAAGQHSFFGLGVAGIAFSTANPSLAVAALTQAAEGVLVGAPVPSLSVKGLYYTSDAGVTWHMATILDGSQVVQQPQPATSSAAGNAATAVVWNPVRQMFYAAVQFHGYYQSPDGITWTRLAHQPGTGLTSTACPANPGLTGSPNCPIFRGALAVQPVTGDTFALTVDSANLDQGLYQDVCALSGSACGTSTIAFGTALNAAPLEAGSGNNTIAQGDYNLALAASASGTDTLLFAGTIDLYRCSLAAGCSLRNTTNARNGCTNPAKVAPAQHALATLAAAGGPLVYVGNDGGLWRSTDGVNQLAAACSLDDASHFQNLNGGLGSLAEVVSFAQAPTDAGTLLTGLGALGSAGTGTAGTGTVANSWPQLATGEGGTVAIDPANPLLWYLSTGAAVNIARCSKGAACTLADFATTAIGAAQVANDLAAIHAPWLLDPGASTGLIAGTCRAWRGPAAGGALWSASNAISRPFSLPAATACGSSAALVRSLAVGGPAATSANAQNSGSTAIYAGMTGGLDGGAGIAGHLFVTSAANLATNTTVWTDAAKGVVTNDLANAGVFNAAGYDVSSIAVDPHDVTGNTVYATITGFTQPGLTVRTIYRSTDAGAHWTSLSANLPNAPANSIVVDPNDANTVYVALDTGVYVTTSVTSCATSNCWSVYGTALPNAPVMQLSAAAAMPAGDGRTGELRAGTYGRGIWQIPLLTAMSPLAPAISLSPSTVAYSNQQVGTASASVAVTVTNTGNASLNVSSVTATGDFSETDNCVGVAVAQGTSCTIQVRFLPTATGTRSGTLTVFGNVAGGQAAAALSGTGVAGAAIVLTPSTLTFPSTNVGAASASQSISIANTGGVSAKLQAPVVTGDFTIALNSCGTALGPNAACAVTIVFAPAAAGARSGTFTLVDDAGTQVASLSGAGTNPATDSLAPTALTFAPQQLSAASAVQQVTLTNAGDVPLTLISASIASGDFTVLNGCGTSLIAHGSCSFSVAFLPKSVGAQSGSLTVTDQYRSQTVALSGTGLAPPGVSLSPVAGLAFGTAGVGLASTAQAVTLTNNGGVSLTIAGIAVSGDFAIVAGTNTCGASLAPAGVCSVQIAFSPTVGGARTGTVTFSDNAANSPQILPLSGTGVDFTLAASGPATMTIASGQVATYQMLLGSAASLSGNVAFTCAGVPAHTTCTVNPANGALGGNQNVTVTVATGLSTVLLDAPKLPWSEKAVWFVLLLPAGFVWKRRRLQWSPLFVTVLVFVMAGCASGRTVAATSSPGAPVAVTPSGSYTLVVAGSSAGLVRSLNLTLVVQ